MSGCNCSDKSINLIYACSGAANTGYLSDQIARKIMENSCFKMTCLSALGAKNSGFIANALAAEQNIVLDGCGVSCGKKIFDLNNLKPHRHFILTDFEVEKGKTKITGTLVEQIAGKILGEIKDE
ncbi:MAG: putative zinc-binding protein [bacterium]